MTAPEEGIRPMTSEEYRRGVGPCEVCGKPGKVHSSPLGYPGTLVLCGRHFLTHFLLRTPPFYMAVIGVPGLILIWTMLWIERGGCR